MNILVMISIMVFVNGRKVNFRKSNKPRRKAAPRRRRAGRGLRSRPRKSLLRIQGSSGQVTVSNFSQRSKARALGKGLTALGVPCTYLVNNAYTVRALDGQQSSAVIGQWNSIPDIFAMSRMVPQTDSTGTVPPFNPDTPTRFHVKSLTAVVDINNTSSGACVVDIYDVVPKRDIPSSMATGNAAYNVGTPTTAWSSGLSNQIGGVPVAVLNATNTPGCVPTDSELFKKFYQIKSHKTVLMPQNAQHQHKVVMNVGRHFDLNEIRTDFAVFSALKGFSAFTMIIVKGQVGFIDTDSGAANYVTSRVNVCTSERYQYQWVQANGAVWTSNYNLSSGNVSIINLNQPATGVPVCLPI